MSEVDVSLEYQIGDWLRLRGLKLVTAESCTGGLVGDWVTNVAGSSDYYLGGLIAYANEAKQTLLGVRAETLEQHGAVSAETVCEMARGVCQAFHPAAPLERLVGISVSGIAGPGGGSPQKPVGLVWIGLSGPAPHWAGQRFAGGPRYERAWKTIGQGQRVENKVLSAHQALQHLLDYLQGKGIE